MGSELRDWKEGANPLNDKQIVGLQQFLKETRDVPKGNAQ